MISASYICLGAQKRRPGEEPRGQEAGAASPRAAALGSDFQLTLTAQTGRGLHVNSIDTWLLAGWPGSILQVLPLTCWVTLEESLPLSGSQIRSSDK